MRKRDVNYLNSRKQILIGLSKKRQQELIKSLGFLPTPKQVFDALTKNQITVVHKTENTDLNKVLTELKRIGNNINQMVYIANQRKELIAEKQLLEELNRVYSLIEQLKKHDN